MKKIFIILISLAFIIISCNNFQNELKAYNDIVEAELVRDTLISDVFLGLSYGDSEKTCYSKLRKLLAINKVSTNDYDKIEYEFIIAENYKRVIGPIKAVLDLKFYNDKLYLITLRASLGNNFVSDKKGVEFMHKVLNLLYLRKYGSSKYQKIERKNILNDLINDKYYIYANNQIKISSWLHTDITYTDLRILKEIEIEEQKEKEIKNEENRKERIKQLNDL